MPKQLAWCWLAEILCFIPMRHFDLHDTLVDACRDQKYAVAAGTRSHLFKCFLHRCWLAGTRLMSVLCLPAYFFHDALPMGHTIYVPYGVEGGPDIYACDAVTPGWCAPQLWLSTAALSQTVLRHLCLLSLFRLLSFVSDQQPCQRRALWHAHHCPWRWPRNVSGMPFPLICYSHPHAMPIPTNIQNTLSQEMLTMNEQSGITTWLRRIIVWVALRLRAQRLSLWPPSPPLTGM